MYRPYRTVHIGMSALGSHTFLVKSELSAQAILLSSSQCLCLFCLGGVCDQGRFRLVTVGCSWVCLVQGSMSNFWMLPFDMKNHIKDTVNQLLSL